ncbi:hypothetical protein Glove_208g81 [Diversispora epigaea]|uniref:Uncharacterized protein n=1 Tax=Diversispora epigaea TaxID=1348612 RepID=A0A397ILS1_9GLOM|nr:hypothetical protein Glove_208g81 [Diversispora epigaea]
MSKRRRFTSTLIGIGYIFPELHYGTFARNWWEPVSINLENTIVSAIPYRLYMCVKCNLNSKDFIITVVKNNKNQQKPGFRCTCENMSSEIESYPSTAINSCYKKVFDTKTEYSGIAVMGFEDKNIIQQLLDKVEFFPMFLRIEKFLVVISGLGYSSKNEYYEAGAGFISTFITRFRNAQHLFLLRIEDDHCFLEIYQDSKMIQQFIGLTPDDVWKKVGILKNFSGSYIFGITHESIQQLLNSENNKIVTCLPDEWHNYEKLTKVTSYIINKARKHARLYGPGAPPLDKPKRKVQRINNIQEEQFKIFFQDRENVTISSYQTDAKTGLPILYLCDQKFNLWNKFTETYPNGMKKTAFMARLNNSTNLKYRDDLGGLCQICNDYEFTTFENLFNIIQSNSNNKTIMNTMFIQLDKLKRHLKRDFEEELAVGLNGKVIHDPCISHCLLFAFGECNNKHQNRCLKCDQFFEFFNFMSENISEDYQSKLTKAKEQLLYFLSHQARKFYLNAQFKAILSELDSNGVVIIADYKMRVLPQSARETKQDFFGKRGWTLHTILFFTKNTNSNELNIEAYDHWSLDTKQDAWFTASAFEVVFETIEKKPKWIKIISDNCPHYHNSELMAIISHWYNWYNIEVRSWLFLEPGEAKTIIDSHHAAITHAIKRYLRIRYDISSGEDIVQAAKGLLGTSLANLEPNRNNEIEDDKYEGYIRARPLPHVGNWSNFSPSYIADLWNSPLYQPQPLISQCTIPETKWTIPITMESDSNENNININIEDIDTIENINKVEREIEDIIDLTGNNNDIKSIDSEFPLIKGWALKSNQKFGGKGGNRMKKEIKTLLECFFLNGNRNQKDKMNAQDMQTELLKYVEAGELAEDDIPKVSTIQNWISTYAQNFKERATEHELNNR